MGCFLALQETNCLVSQSFLSFSQAVYVGNRICRLFHVSSACKVHSVFQLSMTYISAEIGQNI